MHPRATGGPSALATGGTEPRGARCLPAPLRPGHLCVVGLGKVGLPLATQAAGHVDVVGLDVDPWVARLVNEGAPPFPNESGLPERLQGAVRAGQLRATTRPADALHGAAAVVVVVPLLTRPDGTPDFGALDAATTAVAQGIEPGTLVVYETTLPVGTTRDRFTAALATGSGLTPGHDLFVAFSPERVFSGRALTDLRRYPKVVGGIDDASAERAVALYRSILDFDERPDLDRANGVWDLGSAEAAELCKLAETTYRDVNIALANEFARFAERRDIDIHRVIDAANSQPFSHLHRPGIAVGGHCIPVYPHLYLAGDPTAVLPRAAREVNDAMPEHQVARLAQVLGDLDGLEVVILGLAFRGGVKEHALSGAFPLADALHRRRASVTVHDPLYTDDELQRLGFRPYHFGRAVDVAVVQADHREYARLAPADLPGVRVLLDGRGVTEPSRWRGTPRLLVGVGRCG